MLNAGIVRPDDKREPCTCFPAFSSLQAIGFTGAGQVSHIPNHNAVSQELQHSYEKASQRFSPGADQIDEIEKVFQAANDVHMSIRALEKCIDSMDVKWAADATEKFIWLAYTLFGLSSPIKDLFTWRDTPVSWRVSPVKNIVYAIETEADWYMFCLDSFQPGSSDGPRSLLYLRSEIRQRAAKDDDAVNAGSSSTWTPDAEEEPRVPILERTVTTANAEIRFTWTPEAEKEARRLILEGKVKNATTLQEKLSMNRKAAQGLYRHITGKKKKRYRTD